MDVKVEDYGLTAEDMNYVTYRASGLDEKSLHFLNNHLEGDTILEEDSLLLNVYYAKKYFPFGSEEAKLKIEDFIAREEIEMTIFLSSFLEDMK